jgi:membrane protein YqaA with SNARE-associated domain
MIETAIHALLGLLAIPEIGLVSVFLISFISATLVPMGSEPIVFAVIKADPALYWAVIGLATFGNTLGGVVNYGMGYYAKNTFAVERKTTWFGWLTHFGAKTMLLAWLPVIGDPLCSLAGWLRLPFWQSVGYMAVGKFLRYISMTWLLMMVPDGFWQHIAQWFI